MAIMGLLYVYSFTTVPGNFDIFHHFFIFLPQILILSLGKIIIISIVAHWDIPSALQLMPNPVFCSTIKADNN